VVNPRTRLWPAYKLQKSYTLELHQLFFIDWVPRVAFTAAGQNGREHVGQMEVGIGIATRLGLAPQGVHDLELSGWTGDGNEGSLRHSIARFGQTRGARLRSRDQITTIHDDTIFLAQQAVRPSI